ncbi:MAG: methyltransferase domain-containing protein [Actinomycetota bacterium]|nr:methyltransferase domain-containing protein [Actinomycetota bacterium]
MLFARSMISNPRQVGAVWPTSRRAVNDLLDLGDFSRARTVLEFGVGAGVYTEGILKRLHPDAKLLAFEVDGGMAREVSRRLGDPKLEVITDSAENAEEYLEGSKADIIVSSLPFTTLPESVREDILDLAPRILAPSGSMLVLQYSPAISAGLLRRFATVKQRLSPINIPPALLFACEDPVKGRA